MSIPQYRPPSPRAAVADPGLVRPDWTTTRPRNPRLLWLDKNENTDPGLAELTSRVVAEVVTRVDPKCVSTYPDSGPFYEKLGRHVGVGADHLLLAAGSDGVIRSVFAAYVDPGDVIVHTSPTFAMYPVYSRMFGARAETLAYAASPTGPELGVDAVVTKIEEVRPKLLCLPNPDSPTGTVFDEPALRRIVEAAGQAGALVLIDEAYHPFWAPSVASWVDTYEHLVVARTFAKAWGVAGLRIGYAVAAPSVARFLHKVRPMYEVNTLSVAVMERLLDRVDDVMSSVARLNEGRDHMIAAMERLGFRTVHAKGNFMHVAFGDMAGLIHAALEDLVLYRRDHQEPCLKGFTRFSATPASLFDPIIERIGHVVTQRRGTHVG